MSLYSDHSNPNQIPNLINKLKLKELLKLVGTRNRLEHQLKEFGYLKDLSDEDIWASYRDVFLQSESEKWTSLDE